MILAGGHGYGGAAVAKGQKRGLFADERLFHHHRGPGSAESSGHHGLVDGGNGLIGVAGYCDALAGSQAVGLDHHGAVKLSGVGPGRSGLGKRFIGGGGHAGGGHDFLGKGLAAFQLGGVGVGAKAGHAGRVQGIAKPGHQRRFRADHHQINAPILGQGHDAGDVGVGQGDVLAAGGGATVARGSQHCRDIGTFGQGMGQGVLTAAGPDYQNAHHAPPLQ